MTDSRPRFHLAIQVDDLTAAMAFYGGILQCRIGRSSKHWIDFNFMEHQLTAHLSDTKRAESSSPVDGENIHVPHFGVILEWQNWEQLIQRLKEHQVSFVLEPCVRFKGQVGEQRTAFIRDPAGNLIELKTFRDDVHVFLRNKK